MHALAAAAHVDTSGGTQSASSPLSPSSVAVVVWLLGRQSHRACPHPELLSLQLSSPSSKCSSAPPVLGSPQQWAQMSTAVKSAPQLAHGESEASDESSSDDDEEEEDSSTAARTVPSGMDTRIAGTTGSSGRAAASASRAATSAAAAAAAGRGAKRLPSRCRCVIYQMFARYLQQCSSSMMTHR